jgi:phosphoribosylglycinamide formyltransferase-1
MFYFWELTMSKYKIAILVSGAGTNAINIIEYFKENTLIEVGIVISNKSAALALEKAQKREVKTLVFNNDTFKKKGEVLDVLQSLSINFIVLAGFLMKVPSEIIHAYPNKIVNIHPSLLPKFGGKGMYGRHVHRSVIDAQEEESGISIHFVNEEYDQGDIIFQSRVKVNKTDTPESLAKKIQHIEQRYFPRVIEEVINKII